MTRIFVSEVTQAAPARPSDTGSLTQTIYKHYYNSSQNIVSRGPRLLPRLMKVNWFMLLVGTTANFENHAKRTNSDSNTCICCWGQRHVQCNHKPVCNSLRARSRQTDRQTDRQTCAPLSFVSMTLTAYQDAQTPTANPSLTHPRSSESVTRPAQIPTLSDVTNRPRAAVLEKLTVPQLVNTYTAYCETRRFIAVSTTARLSSLSAARLTQSTYPRSILVLSSHLHVGLHSSLSLSGFPSPPHMPHAPPISSF